MNSSFTCPSSRPRAAAGLLTVALCGLSGCGLWSIEPDEIDIADAGDDDVGEANDAYDGDDEGTNEGATTGEADTDPDGTDTFSDEGTDSTGDGDGDTETGDGDTSGDDTTEDTSDPLMCDPQAELVVGPNDVAVANVASTFAGACGGAEGETLYSFTAEAAGDYSMVLTGADFPAVLYTLGADCVELTEPCSTGEMPLVLSLAADETTLVVVDSDGGIGSATLTITGP